jgi:hypothetical protein
MLDSVTYVHEDRNAKCQEMCLLVYLSFSLILADPEVINKCLTQCTRNLGLSEVSAGQCFTQCTGDHGTK